MSNVVPFPDPELTPEESVHLANAKSMQVIIESIRDRSYKVIAKVNLLGVAPVEDELRQLRHDSFDELSHARELLKDIPEPDRATLTAIVDNMRNSTLNGIDTMLNSMAAKPAFRPAAYTPPPVDTMSWSHPVGMTLGILALLAIVLFGVIGGGFKSLNPGFWATNKGTVGVSIHPHFRHR